MIKERTEYVNYNFKVDNVIGDYTNNTIACYGSGNTSGWGSMPSSDTASFGGSGTNSG